jgi:hypothetical protein
MPANILLDQVCRLVSSGQVHMAVGVAAAAVKQKGKASLDELRTPQHQDSPVERFLRAALRRRTIQGGIGSLAFNLSSAGLPCNPSVQFKVRER